MTNHGRERRDRALECDLDDLESVQDALVGLQSTDDQSLVPLHDLLAKRAAALSGIREMDGKDACAFVLRQTVTILALAMKVVSPEADIDKDIQPAIKQIVFGAPEGAYMADGLLFCLKAAVEILEPKEPGMVD